MLDLEKRLIQVAKEYYNYNITIGELRIFLNNLYIVKKYISYTFSYIFPYYCYYLDAKTK